FLRLRVLGHNLALLQYEMRLKHKPDAALGNGGSGRITSRFLESLATLNYPAWGYGLRYKYGLFKQRITKERQEEVAENWLEECSSSDVILGMKRLLSLGLTKVDWKTLTMKFQVGSTNMTGDPSLSKTLVTLKAMMKAFKKGGEGVLLELGSMGVEICYILYPGDESTEGKILEAQYTLCSTSLQDIIARFERRYGGNEIREEFPEKLEVLHRELWHSQITLHVEIIEMTDEQLIQDMISEYGISNPKILEKKVNAMRILENVDLPASLADLFAKPEEILIHETRDEAIHEIRNEVVPAQEDELEGKDPQDEKVVKPEHAPIPPKMVRMANLCVVGGRAVNGAAEIHSEIVKKEVFNYFFQFRNKTNGVTPRRWIHFCNPDLSTIISKWIDNEDLQIEWRAAKRSNKIKVSAFLKEKTGYSVSPDAMFDIQVKRIHEYKRQLLNILGIVYRYKKMKEMTAAERKEKFVPRVCIFGGKAFATYIQAKRIVKFITDVGATINHDPDIGDLLKVMFVPDYNVSVAELLIPASELSQHISTAGMEASGTSNMKFTMNGCVLIGTLDGANVEIRQEVGDDNFFLFGAQAREIAALRKERAEGKFVPDESFEEVKDFARSGAFGPYNYDELMGSWEGNEGFGRADYFLVGKDFPSYIECQEKVDNAYRDQKRWTIMSILNTAGSFKFSSDRTIHEYAKDIWSIKPIELS
ncbi:alpha-1,4 glucan phosphorylase L isozyme, chloroplastic amyloplastic, partial [Olea europaea subsp. europaea]